MPTSAHASRRREAAPSPTEGPPPHRLLKGRLRFPPCALQGARFSPQRPLPITHVPTLKPPRAPRPAPPCPALHSCPGPRDTRPTCPQVTPHLPEQPLFSVPRPSLKGGCPSCLVLEFSPLSTYPPGGPPPSSLTSSVYLWGHLSPEHLIHTHIQPVATGFRAASQMLQTPCLR